jgi:exodeoxyribonuclease VII large subunit
MVSVERCGQLLNALSHRGVLARGFALVRDPKGYPLRQAAAVIPGMALVLEFFDGRVRASAQKSGAEHSAARLRGRRAAGSDQGNLFE